MRAAIQTLHLLVRLITPLTCKASCISVCRHISEVVTQNMIKLNYLISNQKLLLERTDKSPPPPSLPSPLPPPTPPLLPPFPLLPPTPPLTPPLSPMSPILKDYSPFIFYHNIYFWALIFGSIFLFVIKMCNKKNYSNDMV